MRTTEIAEGEYYHICNRSNDRDLIFREKRDYVRFLFSILYFQSPLSFSNPSRFVSYFVRHSVFNIDNEQTQQILKDRFVHLVGFTLMPNHFHLILYENRSGGIAKYMQRVLNGYTKYFNTKYKKIGHLFSGPYRAVHTEDNEQLLHLSAYVHRNQRGLKDWQSKEKEYPWSSYRDYTEENRWGRLLEQDIILEQFKYKEEYGEFVETSGAKDLENQSHFIY